MDIWTKQQGYMAHDDHDVCLVPPRPASENAVAKPQRTKSLGTPHRWMVYLQWTIPKKN